MTACLLSARETSDKCIKTEGTSVLRSGAPSFGFLFFCWFSVQIHRKHISGGSGLCVRSAKAGQTGCRRVKRERTGILLSVLTQTAKNTEDPLVRTCVARRFLSLLCVRFAIRPQTRPVSGETIPRRDIYRRVFVLRVWFFGKDHICRFRPAPHRLLLKGSFCKNKSIR